MGEDWILIAISALAGFGVGALGAMHWFWAHISYGEAHRMEMTRHFDRQGS